MIELIDYYLKAFALMYDLEYLLPLERRALDVKTTQ